MGRDARNTIGPVQGLTRRQADVMELVSEGLSNREIAIQLRIAESSVKTHLKAAFQRLGAANRAQAAATYVRDHQPR